MSGFGGGGGESDLIALLKLMDNPSDYRKKVDELQQQQAANDAAYKQYMVLADQVKSEKASVTANANALNDRITEFNATKKAILDKEKGFDDRATELDAREKALVDGEARHKSKSDALELLTKGTEQQLAQREKIVSGRETSVTERENNVAAKEKEVTNKLAKLKAMVDAAA